MKRVSSALLLFAVLWLSACAPQNGQEASAQEAGSEISPIPPRAGDQARPSPNALVSQAIGTTIVTISYGRPGVKGREVFGGLEPYGEVWRAGANEATVFSFTNDVSINGTPLEGGTYAFFAIPTEGGAWTLIFNSVPDQWGAYRYSADNDVLRVEAMPEAGSHVEWLTYSFEDLSDTSATTVLQWASVRIPFTVAVQ